MTEKMMILGFDGASPDLFGKWLEAGELPVMKKLVDAGAYGPLRSVPNMSSPSAWTSFATGMNPGKHGVFCFTERNFTNYRYTYVNGGFRKAETFWSRLCGKRTGCVINVPMTYPTEAINGCMIAGLDAPGIDSEGVCHPSSLIGEMVDKNGSYRITPNFAEYLRKGADWGEAANQLIANMDMRYKHTVYLMEKYDWDLFTVVFGETDLAHHFFWKFIDPEHPDYRQEEADRFGDVILRIYRKMDEITGLLVERNPQATTLIVSDHGGGINTRGVELVADWLGDLGLLEKESSNLGSPGKIVAQSIKKLAAGGFRMANRKLSKETKMRLARILPVLRESAEAAVRLGEIDWRGTKAFCDGAQDDIWINLKGRDPMGIVNPEEYDHLCDCICNELRQAVDMVTGKPIIDVVYRRQDIYKEPYYEKAADISFRWKTDSVVSGIKTPSSSGRVSPAEWSWPADICSGGHSLDGILIAVGPSISASTAIREAEIQDIAPTVLYMFGEEIPGDFDGKVLREMFKAEYLAKNPPRQGGGAEMSQERGDDIYSDEDSSVIEQRLKDLGYI
ncbi:MAG: alkaline phosphatase family protein [Thermoleophilia bacterium]